MPGIDCETSYDLIHSLHWTQKITIWYGNHKSVPLQKESTLVHVGTLWNYRLVVQHLHKEHITRAMEASGLASGDSGWLQKYHKTVNEVITSLGGEEEVSDKYGKIAREWNEGALPEELKQK